MLKKIILILIILVTTFTTIGSADIMTPKGHIRDHFGSEEFITKKMTIERMETATMIKVWNNYPYDKVTYNISDLQIKIAEDKIIAVKMSGKNKGDIILNPTWHTSEVFKGVGEYARTVTGEYINTFATGGEVIGKATIDIKKLSGGEWLVTIIIPNKYLDGKSGFITFTPAWCGNSEVTEGFSVPKEPQCCPVFPYKIDPGYTNNNPVVPYYTGGGYGGGGCFGGGGFGGYDSGYGNYNNFNQIIINKKCNPCPPAPVPGSALLLGTGLMGMKGLHYLHKK